MTVIPLPAQGRWIWDARGQGRAVRVTTHDEATVVNLSLWRGDFCVGTVQLPPEEVSGLIAGLTEGLARLAQRPEREPSDRAAINDARLHEMERRLAAVEARTRRRAQRIVQPVVRHVAGWLPTSRRRGHDTAT